MEAERRDFSLIAPNFVPSTMLSLSIYVISFNLHITPQRMNYIHFTDQETEAQRSQDTFPKLHSW